MYPGCTHDRHDMTQEPALQALLALYPQLHTLRVSSVVLNPRTIKHDVRTLHAGAYHASMQGQGNPHPHSIVKVPIKEREVARPTIIRPPVVLSVYDPPPKNPFNPFSWSA
jgi:hypothetical protein